MGQISVRTAAIAAAWLCRVGHRVGSQPTCPALLPFAAVLPWATTTKRFTWASHWVLGLADGAAAMGAWIAVRPHLADPTPWLLWLAVTLWIAGFDLIYACQDCQFDRCEGLYSVPARFGCAAALRLAQINHVLTVLLLVSVGLVAKFGWPYWIGLGVIAGLLVYEHSLVRPDDLSRVNLAFFNVNGYISIIAFVSVLAALLI